VGRTTHVIEEPYFVLATQNPLEMEGTYPLPEAQLDRFLLKLNATYPDAGELAQIVDRTTGAPMPAVEPVLSAGELLELRELTRSVAIAGHVRDYAIRLVLGTHPGAASALPRVRRYVRHGASPRGVQAIVLVAKAYALFAGRISVSFDDLAAAAPAALRHALEPIQAGLMPDLYGLSAREALRMLTQLGVAARISGDGFVLQQSPIAGSPLVRGESAVLKLGRRLPVLPAGGAQQ
jgi:MoxR-like ATPase